jgi:hypothetical protein
MDQAALNVDQQQKNDACFLLQKMQPPVLHPQSTGAAATGFNPFIYGNDVDSVDVATRVAMVSALCCHVSGDWIQGLDW